MSSSILDTWWAAPLVMCLVLTGIHGYLGIHVLMRKVIFVDLAMAQIAALGAAYAVLLGYDPGRAEDARSIYFFSLGFTLAGAAVISLTRMRKERVPHEAFIGIVYAGASALAILLLSKSPTEGEQIKHMLVGSLLTVRWPKVLLTFGIYSVILVLHGIFREKFFKISADHEAAEREGISVRFWDFLFYVSFGVVIASSVSVAGVLLVFSYLVIPAVIAIMFAEGTRARVGIAWTVGTVVSVAGMIVSYSGDFPTGPSIVAAFTAALLLGGMAHYVTSQKRSGVAVRRLIIFASVAGVAVWGTTFLKKAPEGHVHHEDELTRLLEALRSPDDTVRLDAIHHLEETKDVHAVPQLIALLRDSRSSDRILEHTAKALAALGAADAVPAIKEALRRDLDSELRVALARAILDVRDPGGFPVLIDVLEKGDGKIARDEARRLLEERAGMKADPAALKKWWAERGASLKWREQTKRFE